MYPGLTLRIDDLADPAKRVAWADLLQDIFELDMADFLAFDIWPAGFRAFSYLDGSVIVANISCKPTPLMIGGRHVMAGELQGVATRPAYRRRGLVRDLMRHVLAYAEGRYECLFLYTGIPDFYRRFGFRRLDEHRFRGRLSLQPGHRPSPSRCDLSLARPQDVALIRTLFARRQPVSDVLGLIGNEGIFVHTTLMHPDWRLSYLPEQDVLIVWDQPDGIIRLLDIVGSQIPSMAILDAIINPAGDRVEIDVLFPPDRLDGSFRPIPQTPPDHDILMVRGPFDIEGQPFMLPLTAVA